jgi:WD40 repeat protein
MNLFLQDVELPDQMAFNPERTSIITITRNGFEDLPTVTVSVRNIGSGDLVSRMEIPSNVVINSDGVHVTAYSDNKVRVYEAIGGRVTAEQEIGAISESDLSFSPDGSFLAIKRSESELEIWDIRQGVSAGKLTTAGSFDSIAFSQDNSSLAIIESNQVNIFDTRTGELVLNIPASGAGGEFSIQEASLSPDGSYAAINGATAGEAGLLLWDVRGNKLITNWKSGISDSHSGEMKFSPDGKWIATYVYTLQDRTMNASNVVLFDVKTGNPQWTKGAGKGLDSGQDRTHFPRIAGLAFSQDGQFFAIGYEDEVINLWSLQDNILMASLYGDGYSSAGVLFSPDSTILASLNYGGIRLWGFPSADMPATRAGVNVSDDLSSFYSYKGVSDLSRRNIPLSWFAKGTSPARYHIGLDYEILPTSWTCPYGPIGPEGGPATLQTNTLYLKKVGVTATITDLENFEVVAQQAFLPWVMPAGQPSLSQSGFPGCPSTWDFSKPYGSNEYFFGSLDDAEFSTWLLSTMAPLGFTP